MSPRLTTKFAAMICTAGLLTAAAAPSLASEGSRVTRSIEISYADLNLATEAGAARLETRIRSAARKVCGTVATRSLTEKADHAQCMSQAMHTGNAALEVAIAKVRNGERLAARDASVMVGN